MNKYNAKCPGCNEYFDDVEIEGVTMLIHPGYSPAQPLSRLPSLKCIRSANYVVFLPCKHCCPESFELCPQCHKGGPTEKPCKSN